MSIPDDAPGFEAQREVHARATTVFEQIRASGLPGLERFDTVSMGMTGDLEAAVAAGSTMVRVGSGIFGQRNYARSEEHTSELQSPCNLVCRLLLEKKKKDIQQGCIVA